MGLKYAQEAHIVAKRGIGESDLSTGVTTESGSAPQEYEYGWPAGGSSESGVTAQWLFDEASGSIVDEVSGLTLPAFGSITYQVAHDPPWTNLSPGVTMASGTRFYKNSDTAALSPGTNAIVVEWVNSLKNTIAATGDYVVLFSIDAGAGTRGFTIYQQYNTPSHLLIDIHGTSGNRNMSWTIPDVRDGVKRKWRWKYNPLTEKSELFINGTSWGINDTSTIGSITAYHVGIGEGTFAIRGDMLELRYTLGNINANSGGPGGG